MDKTTEIFNVIKRRLNVNYSVKTDNGYKFTYAPTIKTWSHKVELITEDNITFLITKRALKINDLKDYIHKEYNSHEADYKIPINDEYQSMGILKEYDFFKLK